MLAYRDRPRLNWVALAKVSISLMDSASMDCSVP